MSEMATIDETRTDIVPGQVGFNSVQRAMLGQLGLSDVPEGDLLLFAHVCQKAGLDPFRKEIFMIGRNVQVARYVPNSDGEGQRKEIRYETVYTIQTGIQGFRKRAREIAAEKNERLGFNGPYWCGEDGQWTDVWPEKTPPVASKYVVFRDGEPIPSVCHYSEYVQESGSGSDRKPNSMWSKMPRNQLAKCAEAAALQRAFPDELSGLILEDAAVVIDEDGQPDQPTKKRRGGKGVAGLADRAAAKQQEVIEGAPTKDKAPAATAMRKALEKRLFGLIGEISPSVSRNDRIDIYRYILGRDDIQSTDDLDDVAIAKVADALFRLKKDGILDKTVRDIVMAADAKAAESQTDTTETE